MSKLILCGIVLTQSSWVIATSRGQGFAHEPTFAQIQEAELANAEYHLHATFPQTRPFRPVEDTAQFAYVLMSATENSDEVTNLRRTIAQNLPSGVKLVILADASDADSVRAEYSKWISPDRLILATDVSTEDGFWARDSFPVPVYDNASKKASLVAAHYYRDGFRSWDAIAASVHGPLAQKGFTFVGGNLLADADGTCFSVDSYRLFTVTAADLAQAYGCRQQHLMPHLHGIGDVDEVLKPLPGRRILTNTPEYKPALEKWGYQVVLLPTLAEEFRTYANALIVNKTAFMPTYGVTQDAQARRVYESLGYKVVGIPTIGLSDDMHGSIHCQTMAYPPMRLSDLLASLHVRELVAKPLVQSQIQ